MNALLSDLLCSILASLPLNLRSATMGRVVGATRCEALLAVIAKHALKTPAILTALAQLQRRVAKHDMELASHVGRVLRRLHGISD